MLATRPCLPTGRPNWLAWLTSGEVFDLHAASGSPVVDEALRRIAWLYAIEQDAAGMMPAAGLALRQEQAVPTLAEIYTWLLATQRTVATGSGTGKAIDHALKRWQALVRYASSGILPRASLI